MKFAIEGLEEGWFYMSLEKENEKTGLVVSYLGQDMVENLFNTLIRVLRATKVSCYFSWTQEPEYQMMYIEKRSKSETVIRIYDFSKENVRQTGSSLPKGFQYDDKTTYVLNEEKFIDFAQQVSDEFKFYLTEEGKIEYRENWVHLDKGTIIPFPEESWNELQVALQK